MDRGNGQVRLQFIGPYSVIILVILDWSVVKAPVSKPESSKVLHYISSIGIFMVSYHDNFTM